MSEWKPIETAPMDDRTRVLVARQGYAEQFAVCWWSAHFEQWLTVNGGAVFPNATHWMPLPQPPKETE